MTECTLLVMSCCRSFRLDRAVNHIPHVHFDVVFTIVEVPIDGRALEKNFDKRILKFFKPCIQEPT